MLPLNRPPAALNPEAVYYAAVQAHDRGDLDSARAGYESILKLDPNQPETNFQMGRLLVQTDKVKTAINHFEKALRVQPRNAEFWRHLIDAMAGAGMGKQARKTVRRAKSQGFAPDVIRDLEMLAARDPAASTTSLGGAPEQEVNLVVSFIQQGRIGDAETKLGKLVADFPNVAFLQNLSGIVQMYRDKYAEAVAAFERAVDLDPYFVDAYNNLGKALLELNEDEQALAPLKRAVSLSAQHLGAVINYADALLRTKRVGDADKQIQAAKKIEPNNPEVRDLEAKYLYRVGRTAEALDLYRALDNSTTKPNRHAAQIGRCLLEIGQSAEAIDFLSVYTRNVPEDIEALKVLAREYSVAGRFDESTEAYFRVLEAEPEFSYAYAQIGTMRKWSDGDPLLDRLEASFADTELSPQARSHIGFALAKAYDDIRRTEDMVAILDQANHFVREGFTYATDDVRRDFEQLKREYNAGFLERLKPFANDDKTPIFVLGMPRSGSTLTEQIISSHPDVAAAGEIGAIAMPMVALTVGEGNRLINPDEIPLEDFAATTTACIEKLREVHPEAPYVTDKLLHTFVYLGLVATLLPNARIVHVHRDPVDNCLSIYKNRFSGTGHRYAYDQTELGAYYALYSDLMRHWIGMLPGRVIDVDYDTLVREPETTIRALISDLGLEWDDACLNPAANDRRIHTLSIFQARQPIYASSVKGWKKYEADLQPLIGALRDGGVDVA
jgi:predicted Zn-dependent protease